MLTWFQEEQKSSVQQPFIHEVISRTDEEVQAYQRWKKSGLCQLLMDWLDRQYQMHLIQPEGVAESIDFLDTRSAQGFVIHFSKLNYSLGEACHTFDLLKERILNNLNYKPTLSEIRMYQEKQNVVSQQRHYLKPRIRFREEEKIDQQFGNVNIEFIAINDKPHQLKLSATRYTDHMYNEGRGFAGLFEVLISAEKGG